MNENIQELNKEEIFNRDNEFIGTPIKSVPAPEKNIGVDLKDQVLNNLVGEGIASQIDLSNLQSLSQVAQSRETVYELLDSMAQDATVSAALEIYAEDATVPNASGDIVWCESDDANVAKFVTSLLDNMHINKHIYGWVYSLCKYGDLYLRLYRKSEVDSDLLRKESTLNESLEDNGSNNETLNEDIIVKAFSDDDHYSRYIESVPNPAEMFELVKMGKTYSFIQAQTNTMQARKDSPYITSYKYSFNNHDVIIYQPSSFVHAMLDDNTGRIPEEIELFENDEDMKANKGGTTYQVRRGQSILYNTFKTWREMTLLENSLILNRVTRSSILRIIGVEVGSMAKESVGPHLAGIKNLVEQKSAINTGKNIEEYTNPGPIENNIYVPTRNGQGAISTQQIGGDVNVTGLGDIDYFKNKFYTSLRIPKQFLGDTDDNTGFNGGTSLSIISSRYAKSIRRIQNTVLQALTTAIHLIMIDAGVSNYIHKFSLKMVPPITQEEIDRQDAMSSQVQLTRDIVDLTSDLESKSLSDLRILKALLSNIVQNTEVIAVIDERIKELEETNTEKSAEDSTDEPPTENNFYFDNDNNDKTFSDSGLDFDLPVTSTEEPEMSEETSLSTEEVSQPSTLPSPEDLGIDMTVND